MKKTEWNEGLNHLDSDIIEKYVKQKDRLRQKKISNITWMRFGVIAACFALVLGIVFYTLHGFGNNRIILPSISVIQSSNKITGEQEVTYGDPVTEGTGDLSQQIAPGFYIGTVIQANIIEVLPDSYHNPGLNVRYLIARLSVVDEIRGDGLPNEIFLRFPYYGSDIFDGYDTFIFSLQQVGIENYMMLNDTKHESAYFPNMFDVAVVDDFGYGSVIAFNGGKVDADFFKKTNGYEGIIENMLNNPSEYYYPVGYDTTLDEAKENIKELSKEENNGIYLRPLFEYVTEEDIFVTNESKEVKNYLEPTDKDVFMQELSIGNDSTVVTYTRVINGFLTNEKISISSNTDGNCDINRAEVSYTEEDLARIPDIGEALANMKLSELEPPNIKIADGMHFQYSTAIGVYRKVGDKVYGIVRIMWYYTYSGNTDYVVNGYVMDDCYYVYDQEGNGTVVDRSRLKKLIGNDLIIARFSYNEYL